MSSTTITVSIGRKVGSTDENLSDNNWSDFCEATYLLLQEQGLDIVFQGTGTGQYTPEDGVTVYEESYTVLASVGRLHRSVQVTLDVLRDGLARLAHQYGQDSIALAKGETEFVEALRFD